MTSKAGKTVKMTNKAGKTVKMANEMVRITEKAAKTKPKQSSCK